MDLYKEALFKEMEYVAEQMKDRPLSTIYFGGGTPTSLNPQDLDEILTKVEELFPVEQAVEFTVESGRPGQHHARKAAGAPESRHFPYFHQSADDEAGDA